MSRYDARESATLQALALSVLQDPSSSACDKEGARERLELTFDLDRLSDIEARILSDLDAAAFDHPKQYTQRPTPAERACRAAMYLRECLGAITGDLSSADRAMALSVLGALSAHLASALAALDTPAE